MNISNPTKTCCLSLCLSVATLGLTTLASTTAMYAQQTNAQTIKGKVVDETGEPLIGAAIKVSGTGTGAVTDINGAFTLKVPAGKSDLEISYQGYVTQKVKAKNGLSIKLLPDTKQLNEVVVTGMVAQDKRLFSGAADRLKADKVKMDGMPDVSRGLEGRSAGVSVQNVSGTFGTAPKIRVRGATSILGSSKPLWVVDGVIQEDIVQVGADELSSGDATTLISSAIAGLNADDIESFQILKDGSATSIYGAKAMAGVIVITTKKGRQGTSSFNYTGEFTTRLIPNYNEFNIMNSQDQMDIYKELRRKGWLNFSNIYRAGSSGVYGKMYHLTHYYNPTTGTYGLENTEEARAKYLEAAELRNTDWFNELFSGSIMQNHSISMSTGTDKSQSYISLSMLQDPGWMKASEVARYTLNVNNTFNFSPKLSLTSIGGAAYRRQTAPGTLGQSVDAATGQVSRAFDINPYSYAINTSRTLDPQESYQRNYAPFNIHRELDNNRIDLNIIDLKFQSELKWRPLRGMTLAALGSVKYSVTNQKHKITENSNLSQAYRAMDDATTISNNSWLYKNPDNPNSLPTTVLPKGGFYDSKMYQMLGYDFRGSITYNTEFKGGHILNTYGGIEFNSQDRTQDWFDGWGMQYESGETPFWDYLAFKQLKEKNNTYYNLYNTFSRTHAIFATATYSYKARYTLTGTWRYEGSNRLGRSLKARWLPTWNISGAWNVHEEDFYRKHLAKALSHLTLKASYSLTADAGPAWVNNSAVIIRSYSPWRPSATVSEPGNLIDGFENSDLTYEKKHELNLGADLGFLRNRISLGVDWYTRNNFDLIGVVNTIGGTRYGNVAAMKSHGFELSLSTKNIDTKKFSWTTDFIFGYNKNQVTELKDKRHLFSFIYGAGFGREGYPVRALFSIPFEGLDNEGFPIFKIQDKTVNRNNYGAINFQERDNIEFLKYEGPTDPTFNGSLGNIFRYGNLRLNVFITYSGGNKIRLEPGYRSGYNDLTATPREFKDRWAVRGDEKKTNIPVIAAVTDARQYGNLGLAYNAYNYSTARVADGTFVRLKEISLSYDLPKSWLHKIIKSASVKVQATNLMLLYADSNLRGQDPEFFRAGGVSAPVPKQFTATLRLGF